MAERGCRLILDGGARTIAGWGEVTTTPDDHDHWFESGDYLTNLGPVRIDGALTILRHVIPDVDPMGWAGCAEMVIAGSDYAGLPLQPGRPIRPDVMGRFEADMGDDRQLSVDVMATRSETREERVPGRGILILERVDFVGVSQITQVVMPPPIESPVCSCPAASWEDTFWGLKPGRDEACPVHGAGD